jgi:tetratricopeptide (TPR) repeat protein
MAKRCFVIQGFGKKQDYEQGKQFDLDASYDVIKEAIRDAGMECYRADELRTSGTIEQVMYDQLLAADLVVADITTLNFNAAYELGVRLALRPYATLIVGEKGMNFPFDVNHIYIHTYQHLGEDIGYHEARRFRAELTDMAKKVMSTPRKDSPVYNFLRQLPENGFISVATEARTPAQVVGVGDSLRDLKDRAKAAMRESRFTDAIKLWREARDLAGKDDHNVQQLALATYKSKEPDTERALRKAEVILEYLKPRASFDPETLGLWAAVHKRLFELTKEGAALEEALFALERGFFIKHDYYNGINLAFMLDTKAATSDPETKEELHGVARYVRRKVKDVCDRALEVPDVTDDDKYWILATLYEACVGLGQEDEALHWKGESERVAKAGWMSETTENQIAKLRALLIS